MPLIGQIRSKRLVFSLSLLFLPLYMPLIEHCTGKFDLVVDRGSIGAQPSNRPQNASLSIKYRVRQILLPSIVFLLRLQGPLNDNVHVLPWVILPAACWMQVVPRAVFSWHLDYRAAARDGWRRRLRHYRACRSSF